MQTREAMLLNKQKNISEYVDDISSSGWGHPVCSPDAADIAKGLPKTQSVQSKK